MAELLNDSLIIMAIGMGLVFIVILLLWGMMELLVKAIKDKPEAVEVVSEDQQITEITEETLQGGDHKRLAAALAVSAALAQLASARRLQAGAQPTSQTNNWQSVLRAAQRSQRGRLFARK